MLFSEYCLYGRNASQVLSTAHEVLGLNDFQEDQVGTPYSPPCKDLRQLPKFGTCLCINA